MKILTDKQRNYKIENTKENPQAVYSVTKIYMVYSIEILKQNKKIRPKDNDNDKDRDSVIKIE